jgi:hypothetical protein
MTQIFKNTITSLLALFLFLFIACKKSKPATPTPVLELSEAEKARLPLLYKDYAVSTEEAIAEALSLMPSTARRSGGVSLVKTYKILPNHARSAEDSLYAFHVVNFADNQGFAIVAGDRRIEQPVFAFVEQGNLTQDSINPGLALFLEMSHAYALQEIESKEQLRDSVYLQLKEKLGEVLPEARRAPTSEEIAIGGTYTNSVLGPWETFENTTLTTNNAWLKFGQGSPFNNYVPKDCGGYKAVAGCVATAMAQIMTYYQYPYGRNWANILNWYSLWYDYRQDFDIAYLMRDIGQVVKMDYGCGNGGSGAYDDDVPPAFRAFGYQSSAVKKYDIVAIRTQINQYKRPIYLSGCSDKTTNFWGVASYGRCHAWVVDGYLSENRKVKTCFLSNYSCYTDTQSRHFFHMNWGWNGMSNGYFNVDIYYAVLDYNFRYELTYIIAHP